MRREQERKQQFEQARPGNAEYERHGQPLPRVRNAATYVLPVAAPVLALSVVGLVATVARDGNGVVFVLLFILAISAFLGVLIAVSALREAKRTIPRILADAQTLHWTCTPEEWQRFNTRAWWRLLRRNLKLTGLVWVFLLVVMVCAFLQPSGSLAFAPALALSAGLAGVVGLVSIGWALAAWWTRRHAATSDVYVSGLGIILGGWYVPLAWTKGGLRRVRYTQGSPGILSIDVGSGRGARVVEVPVPQGHEAEAERLAANRAWLFRER